MRFSVLSDVIAEIWLDFWQALELWAKKMAPRLRRGPAVE
jgi:hypothetical protein